jgi:hypothetical protein
MSRASWAVRPGRLLRALDAAASPAEVSQLLRIAALERYPQAQAAGLTGERWLAFLDAESPGRFAHLRAALTEAPYRAAPIEVAPLRAAARSWLREALR